MTEKNGLQKSIEHGTKIKEALEWVEFVIEHPSEHRSLRNARDLLKQVMAGADIHAGDGGYQIGTREAYEEFNAKRNQSLLESKATEFVMNFYDVTREEAKELYMDEVEAYIRLHHKGVFDNE